MSSTSVTYKPLQFPDEIRLLVLQPARPGYDQPIKWRIKHERLCHKPQYEALSYVWDLGSAGGMKSFSRKTTPTNLSLALQHLRKQAEPDGRVLWIDALCINQKDVKERNHQVTQMGLIYSQAESVIVWLGVGN
ncbi:HET-domain-containing protein, partial [Hyaloscypha bicolor E]